MIFFRPLNLIGFLAAATAGLHLYQTKHEVALMDRELRGLAKQIDEAQDRTQALNAEWAWLNEPERLRGVAQRHLALDNMQPVQFLRLNEATQKLPAVVAYAGPTALFAERPPTTQPGAVQLALLPRVGEPIQVARATAKVSTTIAAPVVVAAAVPAAAPISPPAAVVTATVVTAAIVAPPAILPAKTTEAEPPLPALPVAAPLRSPERLAAPLRLAEPRIEIARATPPRPVVANPFVAPHPAARPAREGTTLASAGTPVSNAPARAAISPSLPSGITQVAAVRPQPRIVDPPATSLGSALGGRALLAPPVPFGSANAATFGGLQ